MKPPAHILAVLVILMLGALVISPASAYYQKMDIQPADGGTCLNFIDGVCVDNTGIVVHQFKDTTSISFSNGTDVISAVNIQAPIGTTVNFTAYYGNGQTITGSTVFSSITPLVYSKREIRLDDQYAYQDFVDIGQLGQDTEIFSYASNMSEAGEPISQGFMLHNPATFGGENILVYVPITGGFAANLITSIDITSDQPITALILTDTQENTIKIAGSTSKNYLDTGTEWINFALSLGAGVLGILGGIYWIIKFFFIDNLLLIIALWIGVSMAYSAISTRDIFQFYRKFFKFQRSLLDFIVGLWNVLVQILGTFRGIFRI